MTPGFHDTGDVTLDPPEMASRPVSMNDPWQA